MKRGLFRYAMRENDRGKGREKMEKKSAARREYGVVGRGGGSEEGVSGGRGSYFAFFCVSS